MKKTLLPALFICCSFLSIAQSPAFVWARQLSGSAGSDDVTPVSIKLDAAGNIYTAGHFDGTVDFDPGPSTFTLSSPGVNAVYILKLDAQGNFIWARQLGGSAQLGNPLNTSAGAIAMGTGGEVYVSGYFQGTVDFDPGPSTFTLSAGPVGSDVFICKLDAQGNLAWVKQTGSPTVDDAANSIAVDAQNNIYTTGFFSGTSDFDPGAGTYTMSAGNGLLEAFVSKLDAAGNFIWARQVQSSSGSMGNDIAVDGSGNVYSAGNFINSGDFDPGAGTYTIGTMGSQDAYLWKLDASGNFAWARCMGGPLVQGGVALVCDAMGNVCMSGFNSGTVDLDPGAGTMTVTSAGSYDFFLSKFDALGSLLWARSAGGSGEDVAAGLCLGASGDVFVTGQFESSVDLDMGPGTYTFSSTGRDAFVSKLDAAGNFLWARQFAGAAMGAGSSIVVNGGVVYSAGVFQSTVDFNPGAGTYTLAAVGGFDAYVHKMNCAHSLTLNVASSAGMICAGNAATLTAAGASSYSWNAAAGNSLQVVSPAVTATFSVTGSDADGCLYSGSITQSVSACTGLRDLSSGSLWMRLYPNPATGMLVVETVNSDKINLELRNALGQLLIHEPLADSRHYLNVEQLPAGIYFITLAKDHRTLVTQKLIKE